MKIDLTNYEIFLIDLLEGTLSAELTEEMHRFLEANPTVLEEYQSLQSVQDVQLLPDSEEAIDFSFLKKSELGVSNEDEMIAALEGDLNEKESALFQHKLAVYPELNKEFSLYKQTILTKEEIVFEHKESLKKKTGIILPLAYRFAAIAAVFAAIGFGVILFFGLNQTEQLAEIKSEKKLDVIAQTTPQNQDMVIDKSAIQNELKLTENASNTYMGKSENRLKIKKESFVLLAGRYTAKEVERNTIVEVKPIDAHVLLAHQLLENNMPKSEVEFFTPTEWLWNKMKAQLPQQTIAYSDSIQHGGAGQIALNLFQKTTGITYQEKRENEVGVRGFSIVSKYFAYERIVHP